MNRTASCLLLCLLLCACASYDVVELPPRQADLYPFAEEERGIWMAIDDISKPKRARKYFGADLADHGIHPVELIVSNRSEEGISVGPADVLMLRGREVIDPLPIQSIASLVKDRGGIVTGATAEQLDLFLNRLAFRETVLEPGQSYHGIIFFDVAEDTGPVSRFFKVLSLYPGPSFYVKAAVTDLESKKRIPFGPFSVFR
ncbi:MAG: hypothetical protein QNK04_02790 [Myxococcota bacterium]|nr:hypothetical protein [Myxococcota bacterium]